MHSLLSLSLLLLSLPPALSTPTPSLSSTPPHPLSLPFLLRQAITNRSQCDNFCSRFSDPEPCFEICRRFFPASNSTTPPTSTTSTTLPPTTSTTLPPTTSTSTSTTSTTTTTVPSNLPALTPSCSLTFPAHTGVCLTQEERRLATLINRYRATLNLPAVPVSRTLSTVAQAHAFDSHTNNPTTDTCNLHSWSAACSTWTPVCYTRDHAQAAGMWRKPREINPRFVGNGYEISAFYSAGETADMALDQWQRSSGHDAVLREAGVWGPFGSMGVGIYGDYAHVWFADEKDPDGRMKMC